MNLYQMFLKHNSGEDYPNWLESTLANLLQENEWFKPEDKLPTKSTTDVGEEYIVWLGYLYNRVSPMNYEGPDKERDPGWFTGGWGSCKTYWNTRVVLWRNLPKRPEGVEID